MPVSSSTLVPRYETPIVRDSEGHLGLKDPHGAAFFEVRGKDLPPEILSLLSGNQAVASDEKFRVTVEDQSVTVRNSSDEGVTCRNFPNPTGQSKEVSCNKHFVGSTRFSGTITPFKDQLLRTTVGNPKVETIIDLGTDVIYNES